jgi:hypothetical protein
LQTRPVNEEFVSLITEEVQSKLSDLFGFGIDQHGSPIPDSFVCDLSRVACDSFRIERVDLAITLAAKSCCGLFEVLIWGFQEDALLLS